MDSPDMVTVTVVFHRGDRPAGQTVEAEPVPAAAFLRAVANQLDPPKPATRAAAGLNTLIRPTPAHQDTIGEGRVGFPAPKAAEEHER